MHQKLKKGAIVAAGSLIMICFMASSGMAFGGPHHNGTGPGQRPNGPDGYGYHHYEGPGYHKDFYNCFDKGGRFDRFLVGQGVPADTVIAFKNDCQKFRTDNAAAFEAMQNKRLQLYEEMIKPAPDAAKAKALQAELSQMKADMDAKRIDHMISLKKTYPQISGIMQHKFADGKPFGPGGKPGPGPGPGKPGPNR